MKRELIELFPEVIGIYTYNKEEHKKIKSICEEIKTDITVGNSELKQNNLDPSLLHYFNSSNSCLFEYTDKFDNFKKWCLDCGKDFMTNTHNYIIEDDNEILITDSWMNVASERTHQIEHNHHNCIISGTYYVNRQEWAHEGIEFYKKRYEMHPHIAHLKNWDSPNKYCRIMEKIYPEEGTLLLWASHLYHGYNGILNIFPDRTTISMNFLPKKIDNGKYAFSISKSIKK